MTINKPNMLFQQATAATNQDDRISNLQTQQIVIYVFVGLVILYLVFTLIFVPFLKKRKDDKNLQKRLELYKSLKPGHEVLLAGGIFGEVVDKQGEIYFIEVAPQVVIKINRNYILGFFDQEIASRINSKNAKEVHLKIKEEKNKIENQQDTLNNKGENDGV